MLSAPAPTGAVSPGGKADRCQLADQEVHCLAKALYDNVAEAPDELAFRKGDVLVVLEQNTNGLEGWWLCSLRGRQGIAPGNRLRLMPGMYDPSGLGNVSPHLQDGGAIHARRRSWKINPNKVVTPQKVGDVYMYDVPVSARDPHDLISSPHACKGCQPSVPCCSLSQGTGGYDTPPSPRLVSAYDEPRPASQQYDLPKPHHLAYDKPRCHSALQNPCNLSPRISSPCSLTKVNDYDVPNSESEAYDVPGPPRAVDRKLIHRTSDNSDCIAYDVPVPSNHTRCSHSSGCNELPLSQRSSGVSLMSSSSMSMISPASSELSLNTSLSLSSICGSNRSSMEQQSQDMYDIPPPGEPRPVEIGDNSRLQRHCSLTTSRMSPSLYSLSRNGCSSPCFNSMKSDAYKFYETPPAPRPAQTCIIREGVYDVPPQVTKDVSSIPKTEGEATNSDRRFSSSSTDSREFKENFPDIEGKELPLDLDGAMERLVKLHEEVQSAISRLFSFVSATWRKRENMESKIFEIKTVCHRLCCVLQEFLSFVYGALANSTHSPDRTLCHKLGKLVMPLNDSNSTVQDATQALDDKGWQVNFLSSDRDSNTPDELDQLVACARILVEDVRQVASFIQGNCTLIFKRCTQFSQDKAVQDLSGPNGTTMNSNSPSITNGTSPKPVVQERPLPTPPQKTEDVGPNNKSGSNKDLINDYDYVNLESKESVEKENEEIKASLPKQLHKCFDNLVKQSHIPVDNDMSKFPVIQPADGNWSSSLEPCDLQVFKFYIIQYDTHLSFLTNAIDAFLYTIENNQPPKVFIGHSKFVVISAHKLVYIGDTVHRNITHTDLKGKVLSASNSLCESLKSLVLSTKKAALQFPSVVAVQEMVDSVVDVSHLASALKTVLNDACNL